MRFKLHPSIHSQPHHQNRHLTHIKAVLANWQHIVAQFVPHFAHNCQHRSSVFLLLLRFFNKFRRNLAWVRSKKYNGVRRTVNSIIGIEPFDVTAELRRRIILWITFFFIGSVVAEIYRLVRNRPIIPTEVRGESSKFSQKLRPKEGLNYTGMPSDVRKKLLDAFQAIQNKKCENWVNAVLASYVKLGVVAPGTTFQTLLMKAEFNFYDPKNPEWLDPNSASIKNFGGWNEYSKQKEALSDTNFGPSATTVNGNQIYLTSVFRTVPINQGRVLVHELLHTSGIHTTVKIIFGSQIRIDPLDDLDDKIREVCGTPGTR